MAAERSGGTLRKIATAIAIGAPVLVLFFVFFGGRLHREAPRAAPEVAPAPTVIATPDPKDPAPAQPRDEWQLVFSDEFEGETLNPASWNVENTPPGQKGMGVNDFSDSTEFVRVSHGALQLRGDPAPRAGRYMTSLVNSRHKHFFMHGRVEARMKVARGPGTNSAFWMMPNVEINEPWPQSGEIDIAEQLGREPKLSHGTMHFPGEVLRRDHGVFEGDQVLSAGYHDYALEWDRGSFVWSIDGRVFHRTSEPSMAEFPFNRPFFLVFSLGVGGKNWEGPVTKDTPNPILMEIDWVRVYQRKPGDSRAAVRGTKPPP